MHQMANLSLKTPEQLLGFVGLLLLPWLWSESVSGRSKEAKYYTGLVCSSKGNRKETPDALNPMPGIRWDSHAPGASQKRQEVWEA